MRLITGGTILLLLLPLPAGTDSLITQRFIWGETANAVIPVGTEQIFHIDPPANLDVGIPAALDDKVTVLNVAGRLFVTAAEPFENHKIVLRHPEYGNALLLLSAQDDATPVNFIITLPLSNEPVRTAPAATRCSNNYVVLTRWVMQQLYAPQRLLKHEPCITAAAIIPQELSLFVCANTLLCGGGATATLIASWQTASQLWLHAVGIRNQTSNQVTLDPRDVVFDRDLLAISFAHSQLSAAGDMKDNTVAVIIAADKLDAILPAQQLKNDSGL